MLPLFLLAAVFSLLAPLYWTHVQAPAGVSGVAAARENPEIYGQLLPAIHYGYARMGAGDWPLWSPQQYCGVPYFANPAHGLFQPLNLIFYVVPPVRGLALHAFLGLFLAALLFALYLRAMRAAYIPAALGGIVYAFGGTAASVMPRPELLGVLVWAPLLYWMVYEYTARPRPGLAILGGLAAAAMILSGALVLAAVMALSALGYGVARVLVRGGGTAGRRAVALRGLAAKGGLGLVFTAVVWLPAIAWMLTLDHPGAALFPGAWAGHLPGNLRDVPAGLLAPRQTMLPEMLYFGAIPLMLIPAALLHWQRRFEVLFFAAAGLAWLGLAVWGSSGGGGADPWKICVLPGALAVAVLAGLGADRLLLAGRDPRSPLIWGAVLLALAAAAVLMFVGPPVARGSVALSVIVLLPFFILRVRWLGVACGIGVAFLTFAELRNATTQLYRHPYAGDENWLQDSLPAIKEAEVQALGERILTLPASRETILPANIGMLQPVENAGGAYWPLTADQARWWSALNPYLEGLRPDTADVVDSAGAAYPPELINYMGVKVVIGERNQPWMDGAGERLRLRFLRTLGRLSLWENETAYPRARWVPHWRPARGLDGAMDALLAPAFSGDTTCVVAEDSRGYAALEESLPPGVPDDAAAPAADTTAEVIRDDPETVEIAVKAGQDGILVLSDTYARGWGARVDGARVPVLQVNGLFRGVFVPAGEHRVVFRYKPLSVTAGALITGAGVLGSVVWGLYALCRHLVALFRPKSRRPEGTEAPETGP